MENPGGRVRIRIPGAEPHSGGVPLRDAVTSACAEIRTVRSVRGVGADLSVQRAFEYRFCPTDAQDTALSRTFGCVRKVYDLVLAARSGAWSANGAEVSCVPLQQALRHLQAAFTAFWGKRSKYPRFKSERKSRASAEYTRSAFRYADGRLTLAKTAGPLGMVWSRPLPADVVPSTLTVSRDSAGSWFVSLLCEDAHEPLPATANAAVNLLAIGLAVSARGAAVRPQRESSSRPPWSAAHRAVWTK
ncbi:LOW QUALITY PROTEIN: IS200-like transposase, partial [Streptomyces sp. C]